MTNGIDVDVDGTRLFWTTTIVVTVVIALALAVTLIWSGRL